MDIIDVNNIDKSIRKLKKGGTVLEIPKEVQADLIEFQERVVTLEDGAEKEAIQKAIDNIQAKYSTNFTDADALDEMDKIDGAINDLSGGNWYKDNPAKMLGEKEVTKDRYQKEITILKGDISVLSGIDVNDNFAQFEKGIDVGVSDVKPPVADLLQKEENQTLVENLIKKSESEIGRKAVRKKKKKEVKENTDFSAPVVPMQDFNQIASQLNKNISQEELKAYVWYKAEIGHKLSNEWYELAYNDNDSRSIDEMVRDWVMNGVLFYINGQLLPKPLFASGDVYQKMSRLEKAGENSGQDVEHIKETYGEEVLLNHLKVLKEAYLKVYNQRLIVTGNETDDSSLILKPISKFAKEFQISRTEKMEELRWWTSGRKSDYAEGEERGTKPDFNKTSGSNWQKKTFPTMSLAHVFSMWLIENRYKIVVKGNITTQDIIYFYLQKRTKQSKTKEEKAQLARTKAKAMTEGNRLFLVFLKEELSLNQKVQLEQAWNSTYNNYLKPDYNKIPVAFNVTNNFFGEEPFVVKQEKRDAVSFIFNEGSGCLAYDVGVGKTIAALMTIEQFLVAGYCKRPSL
jgi:hypothetical protein